jgi:hypothetical protein
MVAALEQIAQVAAVHVEQLADALHVGLVDWRHAG